MFSFLPKTRLYRHLLFWLAVAVYFLVPQWIYPDYIDTVTHYYFNFDYKHSPYFLAILFLYVLGVGMVYAYAFLRWAMPPLLEGRYGAGIGLYLLITVVICYLARMLKGVHLAVIDPLLQGKPFRPFDSRHFDDYFVNQVYIHEYSTIILVLALYKFFTNWLQKQQEANRLEREKISTEIQLLKTQVNPDFVFSSLDELDRLIRLKSKQAPELVLKLAHLLRYVLYESQAETVPLGRELDVISDYVFLQRIIHATFVEVSFTVRGVIDNQRIAPLSLFTLIENTFRQLPTELTELTWVSIDLVIDDMQVVLKVVSELTYLPTNQDTTPTNLDGLQKQLAFYYPGNHSLRIWQEDQINVVTLTISFPTNSLIAKAFESHETTLPDY